MFLSSNPEPIKYISIFLNETQATSAEVDQAWLKPVSANQFTTAVCPMRVWYRVDVYLIDITLC